MSWSSDREPSFHSPGWLRVTTAVGRVTFSEVIRDKILYNILLCSALLFGVGFLASRLMFVRQERVLLDFGVSAVAISCAMIGVLVGASLIGREFERRTVLVALSHPISRLQFVVGKYGGLAAVLAVNWALISGSFLLLLWLSSGEPEVLGNPSLPWALLLALVQALFLGSVAVLFSSFSTTSLSVVITIGVYLLGHNISQIRLVGSKLKSSFGSAFVNGGAALLPNLEFFNLETRVTYAMAAPVGAVLMTCAYAFVLIGVCLGLAGLLIERREA